jgi:hypothetical protein
MLKIRLACFVMLAAVASLVATPFTVAAQTQRTVQLPIKGSGTTAAGVPVTLEGLMQVQRFEVRDGKLHVIGRLTKSTLKDPTGGVLATIPDQAIDQEVKAINGKSLPTAGPAAVDDGLAMMPFAQAGGCDILNLDLGPLHLDLLGLVVDLNELILTITGATGAGNLLGNLLCGIFGLLDTPGTLGVIADLLNSILDLLAILGTP